ncbi:D-glycero-alpha-D-manno-heptose-1,7-bisphosphate 7-phosphatase [Eisenibacter elegans]|jgi:D-glycero-D-manno-heptose 1,7-bisphosphate phosphatase|uniref:D-glycero-alpha-D-manno-heptose-1,7-bisphosphate 7-phosphatase n=1 Tax=Eisenibacter elegans TaxID=997 RepID=UPI000411442C|nr:HAD-IIIA family hydrolase [Eisenibacter elegans]
MPSQKAIFLDRDGVLNRERGTYTYKVSDFEVLPGVPQALAQLKAAGFLLIIVTNQGGIAKGLYAMADVEACFAHLQQACNGLIDAQYVAPGHSEVGASLSRKPGTLMIERACAKFDIDRSRSWLIGDSPRDLEAGHAQGLRCIHIAENAPSHPLAAATVSSLVAATEVILGS